MKGSANVESADEELKEHLKFQVGLQIIPSAYFRRLNEDVSLVPWICMRMCHWSPGYCFLPCYPEFAPFDLNLMGPES